jgi:hypothetical protein
MEEFIAFLHRTGIFNLWCGYGIETIPVAAVNETVFIRTNISFPVLIFLLSKRLFIFYLTKKIQLKLLLF